MLEPATTPSREVFPAEGTPGTHYKSYIVAMLWGISSFNDTDRQAIFSLFPLIEKEMGLTPAQLG